MRTVCVFYCCFTYKWIRIAMLVTYFSVTSSFQTRTFDSRHIIVSHYLPSIMQNNITLETQDTTLGNVCIFGNERPMSAAYNSLQECQ
jgi:hypothetical protein